MIEVLISWIFIGFTAYVTGFCLLHILCRILGVDFGICDKEMPHLHVMRSLFGLCGINVFAQTVSLFGRVGMVADVLLIAVCLLLLFLMRKDLFSKFSIKIWIYEHPITMTVYALLILLFAYGTSRGYMHFDTNLYHAQAIRWIEEYGTVPGLANIQSRFGYNSAEFALNALYGFKWMVGRSLHTTAGYFALISSFVAVGIKDALTTEDGKICIKPRISDYVRLGLIYYLGIIYSDMVSPASDNYAGVLVFDIVILWLDIYKADTVNMNARDTSGDFNRNSDTDVTMMLRAFICILIVYAITIKLSLAPLLLLALIPGIYWIRHRDHRSVIVSILTGLIIALPYFIRGHIISGWILYPSTLISIGSPDWQLPKGMAQYDAREIGMWGRGITDATLWDSTGFVNWIPKWWSSLAAMEKIWMFTTVIALIYVLTVTIALWIALRKTESESGSNADIPLMCIVAAGTVFWFISAPLIRYGYPYLIIMPLLSVGYFATTANIRRIIKNLFFAVLAFGICMVKFKDLTQDILRTADWQYYVNQQDYIDGEAYTYEVDGITVYVAKDAGQIGYYKMPSTVEERHDFSLRGDDLSDGFKHIQ